MKRNIIACALLAALTGAAGAVWAGSVGNLDQPLRDKAGCCPEPEERRPPPPSPEGRIEQMIRRLGLSAEQQTHIRALFAKERETTAPLLKKLAEQRRQFQAAVQSTTFDEAAIRAIAAGQAGTEVELTVSRARLHSRIKALLTPEQRMLADKFLPLLQPGQGARPICGHERWPDHRPPPPWGEYRQQHPDAGDEREQP